MAGFPGTSLTVELRALAREFSLGGVVYFARNVEEPAQVAEVSREIATLTDELPPWVSVDQEGGRVARFKRGFTLWPPMATLGRSGDVELARQFARALAVELRAVGVTLDFAPVLDIFTNPKNTVIGDRALAERAEDVATLGVAAHRGAAARRHRGVRETLSRAMATRWPIPITTFRWSSTIPIGSAPSSSCRFARRSPPALRR